MIELGVATEQLKISYVISRVGPHMVLLYSDEKGTDWVLDNMYSGIHKLSRRTDLKEIYRFNTNGIELGDKTLPVDKFTQWVNLLARINN